MKRPVLAAALAAIVASGAASLAACTAAPAAGAAGGAPSPAGRPADDTSGTGLVPAGYGTLRQDDIAIRLQSQGLQVKVLPLDESVIRTLAPDSYRSLRELVRSKQPSVDSIARRYGGGPVSLWHVSFYGVEPETRFSPMELLITSAGRDLRPLDVLPLSSGFGEQRLRQRETKSAIYVFDGAVDVGHQLAVSFQGERSDAWSETVQRIERERALIRSRESRRATPP